MTSLQGQWNSERHNTDLQIDTSAPATHQFAMYCACTVNAVTLKQFDTKNSPVGRVFGSDLKLQLRLAQRQKKYRSKAEL